MSRKGLTIIELVVSMAIFMVIATIAIGAFISVVRLKALTSVMKESQQKVRLATEMITRMSRQAEKVVVTNGDTLELYFNISDGIPANDSAVRFNMYASGNLFITDCLAISNKSCTNWSLAPSNLMSGVVTLDYANSGFTKSGTIPASLSVVLTGKIQGTVMNEYSNDSFKMETAVILENLQ